MLHGNERMRRVRLLAGARNVLLVGTAVGGIILQQQAYAEEISYNGSGDYSLIRTDTVSGGPRVIDVTTSSGDITLDVAGVNVANSGSSLGAGIAATNTGAGKVLVTGGAVTTSGTGQTYAIDARAAGGDILINSGNTIVDGTNSPPTTTDSIAINALSSSGNVTIKSAVATSNSVHAIVAQGNSVDVTSGTASAAGSAYYSFDPAAAIYITAGDGGARVVATSTAVSGQSMTGILVGSAGETDVESGDITADGIYARGIVTYGAGNAVIKSGTITSTGAYGGVGVQADMRLGGSVNIDSTAITTDLGTGIGVDATDGATNIVSGSVTTTDSHAVAISASSGTGAITIASDKISTFGLYSSGIVVDGASGQSGATSITSNDLHMRGGGTAGIDVDTAGSITIGSKLLQTDGGESAGISAFSQASDVTVTSDTLTTTGPGSAGISVGSRGGNIAITANSTSTTSNVTDIYEQSHAIIAQSQGNGAISILSNAASTVGDNAYAVLAFGGGSIGITSSIASTQGANAYGVSATSYNSNVMIAAATTTTRGLNATAIDGYANGNLIIMSGTATAAQGTAIFASAGMIANVSAAAASAGGDGNAGIVVQGQTGVVLNVGAANSTGSLVTYPYSGVSRADAIYAQAYYGSVDAMVGSATASGAGTDAIRILANGTDGIVPGFPAGSATLNVTGSVTSAGGNGVFVRSTGDVAITIGAGARVDGSLSGIDVEGGSNSIVNMGTIAARNGPAITAIGPTSVDNRGAIAGDVTLGRNDDHFATLTSAHLTGRIDGGAGNNALVLDSSGSTAGAVAFDLTRFVNFDSLMLTGSGSVALAGTLSFPTIQLEGGELDVAAGTALATTGSTTITGSGASETVVNRGTIAGAIDLGGGSDRFENRGSVGGSVTLSDGDDTYVFYAGSRVVGGISGGAGTDTIELHSGGSDSSPTAFDVGKFTEFERLLQQAGVTALSGSAIFDQVQVNGGRLIGLAGSIITAPLITVAMGATFGSAGTVNGNVSVAGTLSPGASPGMMTINGNVSLASGSTSLFELTPTISDKLIVSGTLSVANGATLTLTGSRPLTPGAALDLIVANGGISGSFTTVNQPATIVGFLRQSSDRIQLFGQFAATGFNPQVTATINYVNGLLTSGKGGAALIAAVPLLLTSGNATNGAAFARLNPEAYASATQISIENGIALVKAARSGAAATTREEAGLFSFAQGIGNWRPLDGSAAQGVSRARTNSYGLLGGLGFGSAQASLGAFVGYLDSHQRIVELGARTRSDGIVAGLLGRASAGGFDLLALLAYDGGKADTKRALPGSLTATGRYHLRGWVSDTSVGYAIPLGTDWALKPEAGLTYVSTRRGSATETGGGAFALDVARRSSHAMFVDGELTLRGGMATGARVKPWISAGVRHQLNGRATLATGGFVGTDASFSVPGVSRQATLATAGAGLSVLVTPGLDLFAAYRGEFGSDGTGTNLNGGLRLMF